MNHKHDIMRALIGVPKMVFRLLKKLAYLFMKQGLLFPELQKTLVKNWDNSSVCHSRKPPSCYHNSVNFDIS